MKNVDTVKKHSLRKRIIIVISIIVIITILLISVLTRNKIRNVKKIRAEKEIENKVQLNVDVKKETETIYECVLTFISNDETDKIKSVQYPEERDEPYIVYNSGNKAKIAIDYKLKKDNETKNFKVTTINGEEYNMQARGKYSFEGEDLLKVTDSINATCRAQINIKDEVYEADFIYYNNSLVLDGKKDIYDAVLKDKTYEFGNKETDVATETEDAKNMVIVKVNGDLTINEGVTLTACKSDNGYGGPKGLLIYCTGTIINNGTIDMTARGARAEGQNVYLWRNANNSYEYIPSTGANGGQKVYCSWDGTNPGLKGANGNNRKTGGGGSGTARHWIDASGYSGNGRKRYFLLWRNWRGR